MTANNLTIIATLLMAPLALFAQAGQQTFKFDNLTRIGGIKVKIEGHHSVIKSSEGKAVEFNGVDDASFFPDRPLVGAKAFTIEAIFRPLGGAFMQRWMHIAETDPNTGQDAGPAGAPDPNPRYLFEIRVVDNSWYLDGFMSSKAGNKALAFPDKLYPLNKWYAVEQTYDGKVYRTYVNGELQGEVALDTYVPHGKGHMMVGTRINRVNYFHGDVARARFTSRALAPTEFLKVSK